MRFIIGLCCGTGLVLALAAFVDWQRAEPKVASAETVEQLSSAVAAATDRSASAPVYADQVTPPPIAPELSVATPATSARTSTTEPVTVDSFPLEAAEPESNDQPLAQQWTPAMSEQLEPATPAQATLALEEPIPSLVPTTAASIEDSDLEPPQPELLQATAPGTQVSVWQPFHSEMSAQGFAKRLSLQLGYPFSVIKVAAAEYHVVFNYEDDAQRDLLASQLTALTGYAPQ